MRKLSLRCMLFLFLLPFVCSAQTGEVEKFIQQAENGNISEAEKNLPLIKSRYGNTAEVQYLDALLTEDGTAAVKKYAALKAQFPKSPYAAKAGYKMYQYRYSVGSYKNASTLLSELQAQYPEMNFKPLGENSPAQDSVIQKKIPAPEVLTSPAGKFALKLGVFSNKENADKLITALKKDGIVAAANEKVFGAQIRYVVTAGGFASEKAAKEIAEGIRKKYNLEPSVTVRD